MKKFKTDYTAGGYKILAIFGPDDNRDYAGVIELAPGSVCGANWYSDGRDIGDEDEYDLVSVAPKTLTAYAVLGKNNSLELFLEEYRATDEAKRVGGQVVTLTGEYFT